ncbi:MAG TPA: hypothetical protein VGP44_06825, partial [Gemmatimonadales bacterium]|nr:hypothetical protein [Gemmatimonadales bacterium]
MSEGWLRRLRTSGVGFAFALGLLIAGLLQLPFQSSAQQQAVPAAAPKLPAGASSLQDLSEAFASVAEHVKPSVVYIRSGQKAQTGRRSPQARPRMQVPPGFEEFFRNMPQQPE